MNEYSYLGVYSPAYMFAFDPVFKTQFEAAKAKATTSKDKNWEKILDAVLKYGDPILTTLTKNGIIPNKNIQAVLNAQYDKNALAQLVAANGGTLDKSPSQIVDRSANIFGLSTSNLILIATAIILVMVSQKSN